MISLVLVQSFLPCLKLLDTTTMTGFSLAPVPGAVAFGLQYIILLLNDKETKLQMLFLSFILVF